MHVLIRNQNQNLSIAHGDQPLELGRSDSAHDPSLPAKRVMIEDDYTSRHHVRLEQPEIGRLLVRNLSGTRPVCFSDGREIRPGESLILEEPVISFTIGKTQVDIECAAETETWATIAAPVAPKPHDANENTLEVIPNVQARPTVETLSRWFETLVSVQRAAAGSGDFYDQAAKAIVTLIGLDEGVILLRQNDDWQPVATCSKQPGATPTYSRTILQKVVADKRTFYRAGQGTQSLAEVSVAAASPILDASGDNVIGAVYGSRLRKQTTQPLAITPVEAQLLQTLAGVVGLGIARVVHETEATRLRAQFDQFFTPKLAQALEDDISILEGQQKEITVLFADLRGFTNLSEDLKPSDTCQIITDVLECLTATIRDHDGVLVDYAGDGLMAMWGAPSDQPNHAELACATALEMLHRMPDVSAKWADLLGTDLQVGIGINTGSAVVGNTGTQYKFKYGARGHTVNRASRVEGATKQLGVPILISHSTQQQLGPSFKTRRLFQVRMVGIQEAVQLYELSVLTNGAWDQRRNIFEQALTLYENQQWSTACQCVQPLLLENENGQIDVPSLILATRAIDCLKSRPEPFDPAISLDRK